MLVVLAVYHVSIGTLSLISHGAAARAVGRLYGIASLDASPQLRYAVKMLGLQALALGAVAAFAAWNPLIHRDIIAVLAFLQGARAVFRLWYRRSLRDAFGIPGSRNALSASVLLAEAAILVFVLA